jgi:hypothetical protein
LAECFAGRALVVNDETEMAAIVRGLPTALLKGDKLIAQVDEGHGVTLAAQFKPEETAIECQCLIDIPHLQCDVVEAHDARFCEFNHQSLLKADIGQPVSRMSL